MKNNFIEKCVNSYLLVAVIGTISIISKPGFAFKDHALLTKNIFLSENLEKTSSTFQKLEQQVLTESLEEFVQNVCNNSDHYNVLLSTLRTIEDYSTKNVLNYSSLPKELQFFKDGAEKDSKILKSRFLSSLRMNTSMTYETYVRTFKGDKTIQDQLVNQKNTTALKEENVNFDPGVSHSIQVRALVTGQKVCGRDILITASDEPDYGHDIGLWSDSPNIAGNTDKQRYNFGVQPYGTSTIPFGTQAPFHMGFFHENWLINLAASSIVNHSYVEHRIKQYLELSKFSFATGHDYWGFRFLGWGLHYVQDLNQPYHSTMLPGVGTLKAVGIGLLDKIGITSPQETIIMQAANAHLGFELYSYGLLLCSLNDSFCQPKVFVSTIKNPFKLALDASSCRCCSHPTQSDSTENATVFLEGERKEINAVLEPLLYSLKTPTAGEDLAKYSDTDPRSVISLASHALSSQTADALKKSLPDDFFGTTKNWLQLDQEKLNINQFKEFDPLLKTILTNVGRSSRLFVKAGLGV